MLDFILWIFRIIFLLLLYFFIFQLIKMMFRDLKQSTENQGMSYSAQISPNEITAANVLPLPGAEAGLLVLASDSQELTKGTVFPLRSGEEFKLGRGSDNNIVLVDPFASLEHAEVYGQGGQYWLADRGSKNGTFLNDVSIDKPTVLTDKDTIRIGSVTLQFVRWTYEMESGDRSRLG